MWQATPATLNATLLLSPLCLLTLRVFTLKDLHPL